MLWHGPLARYAKLWVVHALGMPRTFFSPPRVSDPDVHHDICVTYVPWCMPGSLTSGFLWSRWRGKCSRHSRRMRCLHFYASGKRPMLAALYRTTTTCSLIFRRLAFYQCAFAQQYCWHQFSGSSTSVVFLTTLSFIGTLRSIIYFRSIHSKYKMWLKTRMLNKPSIITLI